MKLNYKRTFLSGLAFLAITAFWQMYDNVLPLILGNTFHLSESYTGMIMASDNILALFLLPLFGYFSDNTKTRIGKRMPYIFFGTGLAIILTNLLPLWDNSYAKDPSNTKFISFIIALGILLIAMSIFRSPSVALMPDITPKPLRSQGNAIINLMGALGGILYLIFSALMYPESKTQGLDHVNYQPLFIFISALMFVSIGLMLLTVREPKWSKENEEIEKEHPEWDLTKKTESGHARLSGPVLVSMLFLLASVALWFFAYNALTTWFTSYCSTLMNKQLGFASTCFLITNVGAIICFIPAGLIASRIGRKKTILIGTLSFSLCFVFAYFITTGGSEGALFTMYIDFFIVGAAWALINVNSLPMCVEMCSGADTGKFTGYYYTASMSAQIVTPVLAGFLLKHISYKILFPYAAIFAFLSFLTMLGVRHGDNRAKPEKGLAAFEDMDI
ncbi:MAG: MFS transporter [Clostridiales bacterium]|nr:MFS transporter [Clostridiales bacterium]